MTTSINISGFWSHIEWDADGKNGIDQQGRKWLNINNPELEQAWLKPMMEGYGNLIQLMSKKSA